MQFLKKITAFTLILISALACQDVIELDVPTRETTLVVEGRVTNNKGTFVKVSTTAPYFDQGATPTINEATVNLYEDGQLLGTLPRDTVDGGYRDINLNGAVGSNYEIEIVVPATNSANFKQSTWRSSPELLKRVFDVDSFAIKFFQRPNVTTEGQYAVAYFQEPAGETPDFYRFNRWKNDSAFVRSIATFDDEFVNGLYIGQGPLPAFNYFGPFEEEDALDSAGIEFASISKEYSEFLALVNEQSFQIGSPFAAPPAAIIGNIYNVDDPDEIGFGYFAASATSSGGVTFRP